MAGSAPVRELSTSQKLYGVDVDTLLGRVLSCPAVIAMSPGQHGEAAVYLPGRTVPGLRIEPDLIEVHVVARYGSTAAGLSRQVTDALVGRTGGRAVAVVWEDVTADPPA